MRDIVQILKEIESNEEIEQLLRRGTVCRLALHDDPWPYVLPLNYGFEAASELDWRLYFHAASSGRKIDLMRRDPRAAFVIDLDHELVRGETACAFTMRYRSVMGTGTVRFLEDPEEKRHGLQRLMEQYTGRQDWELPAGSLERVTVFALSIEQVSAKQSGGSNTADKSTHFANPPAYNRGCRRSPSTTSKCESKLSSVAPCSMQEAAIQTSLIDIGFPRLRSPCLI